MNDQPTVPTLEDVARAAGVSTATVSRAINDRSKVTAATLAKVNKAIEALGYTPNFNARAMAARQSHTIGAIIPTMDNAIFARGLQAFQETLHDKGYTLLVSSSGYQPALEAEQVRALVARGADGLLLIGYERQADVYEFLERRGVPMILAWASLPDQAQASVGFDNRASMRRLAERVLEMGHRRLAVISGVTLGNDRAAERLGGIRDAAAAAGLSDVPVIETPYDIENGAEAFAALMRAEEPPTVVMCGNDVLAAGALSQARAMRLDVPGDVSITGFDDIELARYTYPTLTTVHVPHRDMGQMAARELIRMIEDQSAGRSRTLEAEIRMRGSLGAV